MCIDTHTCHLPTCCLFVVVFFVRWLLLAAPSLAAPSLAACVCVNSMYVCVCVCVRGVRFPIGVRWRTSMYCGAEWQHTPSPLCVVNQTTTGPYVLLHPPPLGCCLRRVLNMVFFCACGGGSNVLLATHAYSWGVAALFLCVMVQ